MATLAAVGLVRWGVAVTWTPVPGTYTPATSTIWVLVSSSLSTAAQSAKALAMVVDVMSMDDAQNPSTKGTPFADPEQRDQDRNGVYI